MEKKKRKRNIFNFVSERKEHSTKNFQIPRETYEMIQFNRRDRENFLVSFQFKIKSVGKKIHSFHVQFTF